MTAGTLMRALAALVIDAGLMTAVALAAAFLPPRLGSADTVGGSARRLLDADAEFAGRLVTTLHRQGPDSR